MALDRLNLVKRDLSHFSRPLKDFGMLLVLLSFLIGNEHHTFSSVQANEWKKNMNPLPQFSCA